VAERRTRLALSPNVSSADPESREQADILVETVMLMGEGSDLGEPTDGWNAQRPGGGSKWQSLAPSRREGWWVEEVTE